MACDLVKSSNAEHAIPPLGVPSTAKEEEKKKGGGAPWKCDVVPWLRCGRRQVKECRLWTLGEVKGKNVYVVSEAPPGSMAK